MSDVSRDESAIEESIIEDYELVKKLLIGLESKNEELTRALFNANDSYETIKDEKKHLEKLLRYASLEKK